MSRRGLLVMTLVGATLLVTVAAGATGLPARYLQMAEQHAAIEPTPMGEGHLGGLEPGTWVQLRFPLPQERPLAVALNLDNVVGFTGRGSSYRLIVRRDSEDGPVIHEGPVIAVGDDWNASNRQPVDITDAVTDEHLRQGFIDVYVTGLIEGDGWTVYRHNPGGREITVSVAEASSELRRMMQALEVMRQREIALIPMPREIAFEEGSLQLTADSRIVLTGAADEQDRLAAQDLAEQIHERAGLRLAVAEGAPRAGDIVLERSEGTGETPDGAYEASVGETARVISPGASGVFYGAQTIAQLVDPDGRLPRCEITDRPAYPVRGLQYDVARGQTVPVAWWKRLIRELARCKLNMLQIYGEDDYGFEAYPFLGREGTFTPEKARELSEYAHRYHVMLVPQFESLGHASAVLRHEELADLREADATWVFCTSNPATWEFLDTVYGELAEQFPYSPWIHVGGDEFEGGFGRCEQCRAKVEADGKGALYAEHMNRLNELCREHDRTMLFWPSHEGWTVENEHLLQENCIPTEWIYHGPQSYPQIEQYQALGFEDVWASPAVVCFSRIWPDYRTTWRGIRGFLQAGAERGLGGCMTTTWEWRHGGIVTNSLPGMFYAAECAWSLGRAPVEDYERCYAQQWLGLRGPDAGRRLHEALIEPWAREGPSRICYDSRLVTDLWWTGPRNALREFAVKDSRLMDSAEAILSASEEAVARVEALQRDATRNADLLPYARLAFEMYAQAARKLLALRDASGLYAEAREALPDHPATAAAKLEHAAEGVQALVEPLREAEGTYLQAARQVGAAMHDVERMRGMREEITGMADELAALAAGLRAGERDELPDDARFGFIRGSYHHVGIWEPAQMSEDGATLRYDVTEQIAPGTVRVELEYTRGAHGVDIRRVALLAHGEQVAQDEHHGWAGGGSHDNVYALSVDEIEPPARYEMEVELASSGGTDSRGDVWLIIPEE